MGFGGSVGGQSDVTEKYDGTSWSVVNALNTARSRLGGAGTQAAGLSFGGTDGADSDVTEEYS